MRTRIAPTPSGFLHAGNAFNFLVTDRLAKAVGAKVLLRIDDLDAERVRPEFVEDIFHSLDWLGIKPDEGPSGPDDFARNWSQQDRIERYQVLVEALRRQGALYACNCSRVQMEEFARNHAGHDCREREPERVDAGTPWRLRIPGHCSVGVLGIDGTSTYVDLADLMPDPVILQRGNGRPAYQVASLCDDIDMDISFVVRGADLLSSTACQLHMARLLGKEGFSRVWFHHHALALGGDGQKLSKSAGATSLKAMRVNGVSPGSLIAGAAAYAEGLLRHVIP